jgi:predicted  nucleic acid-binding Zn-ribbon protein
LTSQIDLLAALQEIDQRLQKKGHRLQQLRQQTTTILSEISAKEHEADGLQQHVSQLETSHRAAELQLREEEDKIKEKRVRLNRIRNDRELQALRREIDSMKETNGKLEEDVLQLMDQIERGKNNLTQIRAQINELRQRIETESVEIDAQVAALEEEIRIEQSERAKLAAAVDADLCARYERIFAKRGGFAVVEIRAGTCQGCHMRIPPHMSNQILSNIQQNTGVIFHCPHCGRILIRKLDQEVPPSA